MSQMTDATDADDAIAKTVEARLFGILDRIHQTPRDDVAQGPRLRWALAQFHSLLALYRVPPQLHGTLTFYQGYLYDELGEPEHAIPFYQEALRVADSLRWYGPDGIRRENRPPGYAAYRLGMAYRASARPQEALAAFQQALRLGIGSSSQVRRLCRELTAEIFDPSAK